MVFEHFAPVNLLPAQQNILFKLFLPGVLLALFYFVCFFSCSVDKPHGLLLPLNSQRLLSILPIDSSHPGSDAHLVQLTPITWENAKAQNATVHFPMSHSNFCFRFLFWGNQGTYFFLVLTRGYVY